MTTPHTIQLHVDQPGSRLDQFLALQLPDFSRTHIKKLIQQQAVLVSGSPAKPSTIVQPGEVIVVQLAPPPPTELTPENIPLEIVFADSDLIVINKKADMVVHPAHGHAGGTLVNALLARFPDLAKMTQADADAAQRPGIVHRLDQDTSGLIVVARTPEALRNLKHQFKTHAVEKIYLALVFGQPEAPEGIIDVPLGRDPRNRQKFAPLADGKPSRTHYRIKETFGAYSLLEIGLETGRTHQIRVHLAWLKCPVVGDTVYGRKKNTLGVPRQFLHAWRLGFNHPRTGQPLQFEAPLEESLQAVLTRLQQG